MGDPEAGTDEAGVDRSPPGHRSMAVLAVVGFSIPVVAYFWFIDHYALNIIRTDQWSDIQLLADSYSGHLSFGDLWALHYENRILFPNLIVLLLSRTTDFNVLVEEYVSAAMLIASTGLFIFAHRRRVGLAWVYYWPVAILMLSFVQYENTPVGIPTRLVPRPLRRGGDLHHARSTDPHLVVVGCSRWLSGGGELLLTAGSHRVAHRSAPSLLPEPTEVVHHCLDNCCSGNYGCLFRQLRHLRGELSGQAPAGCASVLLRRDRRCDRCGCRWKRRDEHGAPCFGPGDFRCVHLGACGVLPWT